MRSELGCRFSTPGTNPNGRPRCRGGRGERRWCRWHSGRAHRPARYIPCGTVGLSRAAWTSECRRWTDARQRRGACACSVAKRRLRVFKANKPASPTRGNSFSPAPPPPCPGTRAHARTRAHTAPGTAGAPGVAPNPNLPPGRPIEGSVVGAECTPASRRSVTAGNPRGPAASAGGSGAPRGLAISGSRSSRSSPFTACASERVRACAHACVRPRACVCARACGHKPSGAAVCRMSCTGSHRG